MNQRLLNIFLRILFCAPLLLAMTAHSATSGAVDSSGAVTAPARQGSSTSADLKPIVATPTQSPTPTPISPQVGGTTPQSANIPLISAIIAGVIALGLGIMKLNQGKSKSNTDKDNKKEDGKCNYLKATLDNKIKELTDLKGRVKGKIKGTIKSALEDALLIEEERQILKKIESAKAEYEKIKALYEECIMDAELSKVKTLKFRDYMVDSILKGEKTASIRLFDDKNLKTGDEIELISRDGKKIFAKAKITEVIEKKLGDIVESDLVGHEPMRDNIIESLKKYYGDKVSRDTPGKIIRFKLSK